MSWDSFIWFAAVSVILWAVGSILAWTGNKRTAAMSIYGLGIAVFFAFILAMWISLERPPLRTMGETRLWYSFFLAVAGMIVYSRWKYKWILSFSTIMALVFIIVNLMKPEIKADLEERLGVKVIKVDVGAVDFLRDMAVLRVVYEGKSGGDPYDNPKAYQCAKSGYYIIYFNFNAPTVVRKSLEDTSLERHTYIQIGDSSVVAYTPKLS